jgi:hypothetical protein
MEKIKRNPASLGLLLGGAIAIAAGLFSWVTVTNTTTDTTTRATAFRGTGPQTLFLCACVVLLAGIGVLGSSGRTARIIWALLGLLAGAVILAAGLMGIFSPESLATRFIESQAFTQALSASSAPTSDQIQAAFDAGTLSASVGLGAIIGVVGGALGVLGALWSFGTPRQPVEA